MHASPPTAKVLVVVPALNEAAHIASVLQQLRDGIALPLDVSFVVSDGGSTDGTQAVVTKMAASWPSLRLVHNPMRLQGPAVNAAAKDFGKERDVLIRCDAHATYPAGYITRLVATLASTGADAVVVPMDSQGATCFQRAVAWVSDSIVGSGGSAHRGGRHSGFVDHGHHAAFRMSSFLRAGGYDETFSHNEDADLDCRQRALGSRIYLDADIRLGYWPRSSFGSLWRQYRNYGKGRSRTMRRHPNSWRVRQLAVPLHVLLASASLLAIPLNPWAAAYAGAYVAALAVVSLGIAWSRRSLCGLLAGPAALTMHVAWAAGFAEGWLTIRESRWSPPPTPATAEGSAT